MSNDNKRAKEILLEIEAILENLIHNAERLKEISSQVISMQELEPLQKKQEELVKKLGKLDEAFKKVPAGSAESYQELTRKIEQKLVQFQKLNAKFIENLSASQGLIRFDVKKKKKDKGT